MKAPVSDEGTGRNLEAMVSVVVPTLNEARNIDDCLASIRLQTYPVKEILVVDGGSTDLTRAKASLYPGVRIVDNPSRLQSAALNLALSFAQGDVIVRVDGHSRIRPDYVESCVKALHRTGAAIVGGRMNPVGQDAGGRAIAGAFRSRLGVGTAHFHVGRHQRWVDTVYMGAFRKSLARDVGGYAEVATNEDAEFAFRMKPYGGVWFDPEICSEYRPRSNLVSLGRQFYRYGIGRARTVRSHPSSLAPRQLAAPLLLLGLASPFRRHVAVVYGAAVACGALSVQRREPILAPMTAAAMMTMHIAWGIGFMVGLVRPVKKNMDEVRMHTWAGCGYGAVPQASESRNPPGDAFPRDM